MEEIEKLLIKKALDRYSGNVRRAAEALGLSRSTFYRDLAVFTFDEENRLRLVNDAGIRLLNRRSEEILGPSATSGAIPNSQLATRNPKLVTSNF
jgi:Bacterial regulatory protein, Fis family